jgi:hypothetical protein
LLPALCGPLSSAFISETRVCPPTGVKSKRAHCLVARNSGPNTTAVIKGLLNKVKALGLGRHWLRP